MLSEKSFSPINLTEKIKKCVFQIVNKKRNENNFVCIVKIMVSIKNVERVFRLFESDSNPNLLVCSYGKI